MHFMPCFMSAFVVFCFTSWSKCHASSLGFSQSGTTTSNDVTARESIDLINQKSVQNLRLPVTQPIVGESLEIKLNESSIGDENSYLLYNTESSVKNDTITGSNWPSSGEVTEQIYGVTENDGVTEFTGPISIEPDYAIDDVTESVTRIGYFTLPGEDIFGETETTEPASGVTQSYWEDNTESTNQITDVTETLYQNTETTEYSSPVTYVTETDSDDTTSFHNQDQLTTEFSSSSTLLPGQDSQNLGQTESGKRHGNVTDTANSHSDAALSSDQSESVTTLGRTTESYARTEIGRFSDKVTEKIPPTAEIPHDDVTETIDALSQSGETSQNHNSRGTDEVKAGNATGEDSALEDRKTYWNRLTETNQIYENNDIKSSLKKRWKGRFGKKDILDEMGFVVSHPEEEMMDEEDDLKIFEAVVTSMAQWELNKMQKKMNRRKRVKRDEEMVCYKDLGCFRDEGPFDYLDMLPSPPEEINTRFLLFTRERADREKVIRYQNMSTILDSHFNISRPTKMLIHGFGSSCYSVWIREMREALLMMMDVNIICVNWQKGAEVPNYVKAASNTRLVGRQVAVLIETMNAFLNTTLDDFHLIGFSLGAHVSGHAGARLKNLSRISGLDPAGPLFESYSPSVRLDQTDARFVDVIHTNADSLLMGGLGAFEAMGHVDFYPNGGRMQKGCANLFVGGVSDILWPTEGDGRYLCNHRRGYKYYLNSVAPICKFPAFICKDHDTFLKGNCFPCTSCGNMGYFSNEADGRGQLYLVTRDTEPFCANQYKVSVKHSGGPPADLVTTYGRVEITFIASDGLNETLQLTQSDDMAMEAGSETVRILVPHPALVNIMSVQLRYTAYQGWIYSGFARWAIDKIALMDSFGHMWSFCNRGTTLVTGQAMQFTLLPGECTVRETMSVVQSNNLQPFLDSLPEESENEVRQVAPLQIAVAPRLEPRLNFTKTSHGPINLTHPIPAPLLTPINAHSSILTPVHGQPPLSITLELPPHHIQELPPTIYNVSPHQRLPPRESVGHMPPNNPHPMRYGNEPVRATTNPTTILEISESDVAVSSEEPVSVIPAPNLANVPRPFSMSHFQMPSQEYRPDALRLPETVPFTPYVDSTSSTINSNFMVISTESQASGSKSPPVYESSHNSAIAGNLQSAFHTTRVEFFNQTAVRMTTVNQDVTEKNIFDSTFSPRTNGVMPGDSSTTPLPPAGGQQSPISPRPIIRFTSKSTSPKSPTSQRPPSDQFVPYGHGVTQQYIYSLGSNKEDIPPLRAGQQDNPFLHSFRPPPPTLRPHHTQSSLSKNIPTILDSNSLIDGEIHEKDRARALTLVSTPGNSIKSGPPAIRTKVNCSNASFCPPHINFNISDRAPMVRVPNIAPSPPTLYSNVPSYSLNPRPPVPFQGHPIRQGNPQRKFPSAVDAPPHPHSSYMSTYLEDSRPLTLEESIRPDATYPKSNHDNPVENESQRRSHNSQALPSRLSFDRSISEEPSPNSRHPNTNIDAPSLPPPNLNPPPLETIVGHGRAPQPVSSHYAQDSWVQDYSQKEQQINDYHLQRDRDNQPLQEQQSFLAIHPQSFTQQSQFYHLEPEPNHNQESIQRQSVSVSVGNVTRMNVDGSDELGPHSARPPVPFYVQILPPAFSHLPHLETYSVPRDARKAQDTSHRKRGGVGARVNRGRSLSGSPVPPPGGRGAVFKPLLLQLQDNRHGRYIPLRPPPPEGLRLT